MKQKKIIILQGSPRKNGNCAALTEKLREGAAEKNASVEEFYLQGMDIKTCSACDACRKDLASDCIINDDMKPLYPKLREADAIVFASPIYWFTISAQTKLVIDRCYALLGANGEKALSGKDFGVILTYGDADPFKAGTVNALRTFQDMINYLGANIVGMVYGTAYKAGEIKSNKSVMENAYKLGKKIAATV
jgi:multimeric flavodoxin WrbA